MNSITKRVIIAVIVMLLLVATAVFLYKNENLSITKTQEEITKEKASQLLNNLPLTFQKNEGQVDEQVEFLIRNGSTSIFFTPAEVVYSIVFRQNAEELRTPQQRAEKIREDGPDSIESQVQVIRQKFVGANADTIIEGGEEQTAKVNYLIGNDPDKWVKEASTFGHIVYKDLYDGIDLYYSGKTSLLKYEYHVQPNVDYKQIQILIEGSDGLSINPNGDLVIQSELGNLGIKAPEVYQTIGGNRVDVVSSYELISDTTFTFQIGEYDSDYELIIDPYVIFSTYLGGNDDDYAWSVDIDGDGDVYVTGQTESTNWPGTSGFFQENAAGNVDAFVVKLNSTATSLIYSTYIGGTAVDIGYDLAVHSDETVYITGNAGTGFPFVGGGTFNTAVGFDADFILRLSADGTSLIFSSETNINPRGITIDGSGNAYVVGTSAFDPVFHTVGTDGDCDASSAPSCDDADDGNTADDTVNSTDITLLAINSSGNSKLFAASYGGSNTENAYAIDIDGSGNLYIAGRTLSTNFPADDPLDGFQTTISGGQDAFLIRTNSAGVKTYGTLIGGGGFNDYIYGVAVDPANAGYVAIAGYAENPGGGDAFPTKNVFTGSFPYAYDATIVRGGYDGFAAKVNTGSTGAASLIWSSLLGGDQEDFLYDVDVDSSGNVYVIGEGENASSEEYPVTTNAAKSTPGGSLGEGDIVVSKISDDGSTLLYSSFHRVSGGHGDDFGRGLAVNPATGVVYGTGRVNSSGMSTNGVIIPTFRGGTYDGLVFAMSTVNVAPQTPTLVSPAEGGTATSTTVQIALNLVDLDVGSSITADVRISSGSSANCIAGVSIVSSGTTPSVDSGQNAVFQASGLTNGNTYTVCYRAYDGSLYSDSGSYVAGGASGFTVNIPSLLEYSTYLGGSSGDYIYGIDVDDTGDIYLFGGTGSANFPTTGGVFLPTITASGSNGIVARISPDGAGSADLVFSTFIGGTDCSTEVWGGKVDGSGNSYFTGYTCDTDYPVASAFQSATTDQFGDAIFTKMTSDGTALFYSTYIGADGEYGLGYTLEVFGTYAYVVGETYESSFPITAGAFDTVPDGELDTYNGDAFMTVINHNVAGASSLHYSTFLGSPTRADYISDVAVDGSGNAYLVGAARAADFPTTTGAYDETYNGGTHDLFVSVIDPSGNGTSDLLYSSFIGGSNVDRPGGIAIDASNVIHVAGRSNSTDYPTTVGAYSTSHNSGYEWVITKINPAGTGVSDFIYSTYISATGSNDEAYDIVVSGDGDIFAAGRASDVTASNFPTTANAFDSTYETTSNGVIVQLSPDGAGTSDLVFSSFIGGSGSTNANVLAIDSTSNVYIGGDTSSAGYQTTSGAYDETINGGQDGFAMKLNFASVVTPTSIPIATYLGGNLNDSANGVGLDTSGNIFVTGTLRSSGFPVVNELDATLSGTADGYVVKLNSTGTTALISTYFGGSLDEYPYTGRVDSSGNFYVVGATNSTDLFAGVLAPNNSGFDTTGDTSFDAFLIKFNEAVDDVLYGTYIGGSALDTMDWKAMRVDNSGIAYVAGATQSNDFPLTANAFDSTNTANRDSFVTKIDTTQSGASSLLYSSLIGGDNSDEYTWGVNYDSSGNIYVVGEAYSSDFGSTTVGAYDTTLDTTNGDGYLVQIDPTGTSVTSLVYGTFMGSTLNYDAAYDVLVDETNSVVHLCGSTYSSDFPTTANGYQQTYGGSGDMWHFKMQLNGNGASDLLYASFLGGAGEEWCNEITLDSDYALSLFGDGAAGFPTTPDAYQATAAGGFESIIARFNPVGGGSTDLAYASYVGGTGNEFGSGSYLNQSTNRLFISVNTVSVDAPVTSPSYQSTNNGGEEGYIAALDLPDLPSFSAPSAPTDLFVNDSSAQLGEASPTGITAASPVFSAICNDPDTGDIMQSYQVQVDDTDTSFASIIWDSGKQSMTNCIDGNRSQDITYGGTALSQDGSTYYIRIKFWDDSDTEGSYSTSGDTFTMATEQGGGGIFINLTNQTQNDVEEPTDTITEPEEPVVPEENVEEPEEVEEVEQVYSPLSSNLSVTDLFRNEVLNPVNPDRIMYSRVLVQNVDDFAHENLFFSIDIPQYLRYISGSLQVNGETQSEQADFDHGQISGRTISTISPTIDGGEVYAISFQLGFDLAQLRNYVKEELGLDADRMTDNDVVAVAITELNITLQGLVSSSNTPQVSTNPYTIQPNLDSLEDELSNNEAEQPEQPTDPIQPPVQEPVEDLIDEEEVIILQDQTPQNQVDTQENELFITGEITQSNNELYFSGTVSEPNADIVVILNNSLVVNARSSETGSWDIYVDAEELGIAPGQSGSVSIIVYALNQSGQESNRLSQSIFVDRPSEGPLVTNEIEQSVSDSAIGLFIREFTSDIIDFVEDNEPEIQTSLAITVPIVIASSAPLWGYLPYTPTLAYHFVTWILGLIGRKKRKEGHLYGTVYDSITKEPIPLAIVRIYAQDVSDSQTSQTNRLVATVVTDKTGRYEALLKPGNYKIQVVKPTYSFPSTVVSGSIDGEYDNVSDGELQLTNNESRLPDLPIDPANKPKQWSTANVMKKLWLALQNAGNHIAVPVLLIGSLAGVLMLINNPLAPVSWILTLLYVFNLILQLNFRAHPVKQWGIVYDLASGSAIPLVTLQLIDPEFGKVVKSRLSDYQGRFAFLPEPGEYVIRANKEGYTQPEIVEQGGDLKPIQGKVEIKKEGEVIDGDIALKSN